LEEFIDESEVDKDKNLINYATDEEDDRLLSSETTTWLSNPQIQRQIA